MQDRREIYIGGAWVASTGTDAIDVINASTEEVMGRVPDGTPADVDRAVLAARAAFEPWAATSPADRAKYVQGIAEGIGARRDEIAATIAGEVGMPIFLSGLIQAGLPQAVAAGFPAVVEDFPWEEEIGNSLVVREPVGVVGAITPWNYPLHQIVAKVAPALVAGCTVVLKPSEIAPLNAFILAEIIHDVGLPAGVFNLVSGTGPVVGEAIAGYRGDVFLATKVHPEHATYAGTLLACEKSLRRLRTDHLDLLLLHWRGTQPLEETFRVGRLQLRRRRHRTRRGDRRRGRHRLQPGSLQPHRARRGARAPAGLRAARYRVRRV